jgi:transcriptional regulator with XRE-family HTH domain
LSKTQKSAAIGLLGKGLSQSETARKLGISRQIVNHWLKCPDFQCEVEKARIDFLAAQEPQEEQKKPEAILLEKIPIPISEPITTFKSVLRQREIDLLSKIELNLLPQLLEGSLRAASVLLKLSERRSKLLGLDLPSWEILQAFEILILEKCADPHQIAVVVNGLDQITKELKCRMDVRDFQSD